MFGINMNVPECVSSTRSMGFNSKERSPSLWLKIFCSMVLAEMFQYGSNGKEDLCISVTSLYWSSMVCFVIHWRSYRSTSKPLLEWMTVCVYGGLIIIESDILSTDILDLQWHGVFVKCHEAFRRAWRDRFRSISIYGNTCLLKDYYKESLV